MTGRTPRTGEEVLTRPFCESVTRPVVVNTIVSLTAIGVVAAVVIYFASKGIPAALITASILSMAFMGFAGLV